MKLFSTAVEPDYRRVVAAARNRRPEILPLYEHNVCTGVISALTGTDLEAVMRRDRLEFFRHYCGFFRQVGYDVVTFEQCITSILPDNGALYGGRPGPIQDPETLAAYPWETLADRYWDRAAPQFEALGRAMPPGMKAIGGVGNGVFEISEDLTGLEYLPFLQLDHPEAYEELYRRIGDLTVTLWERFLKEFGEIYCVCRFGDDLGFRSSLLTMPATIREQVIPQYRRVIDLVHRHGKPFLLHSCGCIFEVMEDLIAAGIDAKHSNEDAIAPFAEWIDRYSGRIGLFGGIDMDRIVSDTPENIRRFIRSNVPSWRATASGFAVGTGNSIPDYVPPENYLAMLEAVEEIRSARDSGCSAPGA